MLHSTIHQRSISWTLTARTTLALALMVSGAAAADSNSSDGNRTFGSVSEGWTGSGSLQKTADESWKTNAFTGFEFQGETDLDGGGDFKFWMISGGVNSARMVGDSVKIAVKGDYRAVGYDFGGITGGVDPWETVHVLRLNPVLTFLINDRWSVIGGPIVEFSGEENADFSDSLRGGGLVGVGYKRETFYLALGVLAVTEIEKDARIQPFVIINWDITDSLALGLKGDTSRGGEVRLDYGFTDRFTMGIGIGSRRELFRLNGDGPAATGRQDGVGEETSTVAKITAVYQINDRLALEGYGGVTADGEFRLENKKGTLVVQSDYDDAGFGGLNLRFTF